MATYAEVRDMLSKTKEMNFAYVNETLCKVEFKISPDRTQVVYIIDNGENITFNSVVCELSQVNLEALFASTLLNKMIHGVGPIGKLLAVKHVALLKTLQVEETADAISALAVFGDTLEKAIVGGDFN